MTKISQTQPLCLYTEFGSLKWGCWIYVNTLARWHWKRMAAQFTTRAVRSCLSYHCYFNKHLYLFFTVLEFSFALYCGCKIYFICSNDRWTGGLFSCHCGNEGRQTEAAMWHFHCDQLLSVEQSPNCRGFLARWEKSLGIAEWMILSALTLCPTVQKYAQPFERHSHVLWKKCNLEAIQTKFSIVTVF